MATIRSFEQRLEKLQTRLGTQTEAIARTKQEIAETRAAIKEARQQERANGGGNGGSGSNGSNGKVRRSNGSTTSSPAPAGI